MAIIFQDQFEGGIFVPPWTGSDAGAGLSIGIVEVAPHHGTLTLECGQVESQRHLL